MSLSIARRKYARIFMTRVLLYCTFLLVTGSASANNDARVEAGRRLAHDFEKGNCLACHAVPTDTAAITKANIGPPLIGMRERFKDRELLRRQIWDAATRNPNTIMPPFGRHMILTDDEIDLIIDYVHTL
jgi:sulfur-oxidizing protein SoxX